ncbi:gamma-glutamyl-gamma-aminobutyrate hydrolase family protein [bacterium]|nr:gamma-glutamyl-gamma-aminobutyrate hydrolase family protein [bacterium]
MEKIRIGIAKGKGELKGQERYIKAIEKARGETVLLPPDSAEELEGIRGLLLAGGGDVDPSFYNEENEGSNSIDRERDEWEIKLVKKFREDGKPILGICRGIQVLNVALGGSLHQDIKGHSRNNQELSHLIRIKEGSFLYEILGGYEQIEVNSSHHQAIKDLATTLEATAWSEDGFIEAVEGNGEEFVLGVQFHPERLIEENKVFLNIFKSFINACRKEIFTLGTSNRDFKDFLCILNFYGIEEIIDVRRFPTSKFEWFKKENFERGLRELGFSYIWMGEELGGYRSTGYEAYMSSKEFKEGLRKLIRRALIKRVAIVCAELFPWRCHRRFISSALTINGWQVRHILNKGKEWKPKSSNEQKLPFEEGS